MEPQCTWEATHLIQQEWLGEIKEQSKGQDSYQSPGQKDMVTCRALAQFGSGNQAEVLILGLGNPRHRQYCSTSCFWYIGEYGLEVKCRRP